MFSLKNSQTSFLGGEKTAAKLNRALAQLPRAGQDGRRGTHGEQGWGNKRGWRSSTTALTWLKKAFSKEKRMREHQKWGWTSGDHQEQEIREEGERKEQKEV